MPCKYGFVAIPKSDTSNNLLARWGKLPGFFFAEGRRLGVMLLPSGLR